MIFEQQMSYSREKIIREDQSYYNLVELRLKDASRIDFEKVENKNFKEKLFDTAHLRLLKAKERGVEKPLVIVWAAYGHQISAADFFPELLKSCSEEYLSLNALIKEKMKALIKSKNYIIRDNKLRVKALNSESARAAQKIISFLESEERIKVYQSESELSQEEIYRSLDYKRDLIAVGEIAYPSNYSREHRYPLSFNGSYFLLEEADWESKYSLLGDHYGLLICEGEIISPPLFKRSTLLKDQNNNWELKKPFLSDLSLKLQGKKFNLANFEVNKEAEFSLYNRYFGVEENKKALGITPAAADKIEIIIIDNQVVGVKSGGENEIAQNSLILSLPAAEFEFDPKKSKKVEYSFNSGKKYQSALQAGPLLVEDFKLRLAQDTLKEEEFFGADPKGKRGQFERVVPTDYAADIDQTRAARLAAGISAEGEFCLLAVESVNTGMEAGNESSGATLLEMAELAHKRNYKYALNLDGGGSANIQYLYGKLLKTADRRGLPEVVYERMVPVLGFIKQT
ncbi:phosphodiester glycosidase family protein [Halanaerobium sp. ST460_2HS_T2]|uniref:phosphodiester glycosidase family protein n=1 Tax=Halanaerobium sp. ST460_2HS_T2 TaxID=2183914 RepID=UPI000DF3F710|nr:phosphodiester glycosidase family protein [Halanaerobium sp. ST460_2HS_T2]RCW52279.1 uncharacterized protein DUF2233 [Halanaerobium sp. ST460_2HS_T2]